MPGLRRAAPSGTVSSHRSYSLRCHAPGGVNRAGALFCVPPSVPAFGLRVHRALVLDRVARVGVEPPLKFGDGDELDAPFADDPQLGGDVLAEVVVTDAERVRGLPEPQCKPSRSR